MTQVTVELSDLAPAVRIREAALRLYAEHGTAKTSIRMIAEAAGLSTGSVMHHYKSKDELSKAVQAAVLEQVRRAVTGVGLSSGAESGPKERGTAYDRLIHDNPHLGGYIRQITLGAGPDGLALWAALSDLTRSEMDTQVAAGIARPLPDPDIGLVVYRAMTGVHIYFRPLIEQTLGLDLSDPRVLERFRNAVVDLLTNPLFGTGANPSSPRRSPAGRSASPRAGRRPSESAPGADGASSGR